LTDYQIVNGGQTYLAYYLSEPDKAKTQSDRIFGEFYDDIFNAAINEHKVLAAVLLGKLVDAHKDEVKGRLRSVTSKTDKDEFIIEGSLHVLFALSLICRRKGIDLEDFPRAQACIEEAVNLTRSASQDFRGTSFYKFFRSVRAKEIIEEAALGIEPDLFSFEAKPHKEKE
jgi:hypothetical protein